VSSIWTAFIQSHHQTHLYIFFFFFFFDDITYITNKSILFFEIRVGISSSLEVSRIIQLIWSIYWTLVRRTKGSWLNNTRLFFFLIVNLFFVLGILLIPSILRQAEVLRRSRSLPSPLDFCPVREWELAPHSLRDRSREGVWMMRALKNGNSMFSSDL